MKINNGMSERELVETASKVGVKLHGLSEYYNCPVEEYPKSTMVIGYSGLNAADLTAAVTRLEEVWCSS